MSKTPRVVGRIGDRDPLNDGGVILDYRDGDPRLAYMVSCEMGEDTREYYVYTACPEDVAGDIQDAGDDTRGWIVAADVEASAGMKAGELRQLAESADIRDKCFAVLAVAGHYGWENFDSYPERYNEKEAERRAKKWDTSERTGRPIRWKVNGKGN